MKTLWCWRCSADVPMLEDHEWTSIEAIWRAAQHGQAEGKAPGGDPLLDVLAAYNRITGAAETNPAAVWHHRVSLYGPECTACGRPLRTPAAKLCASCGLPVRAASIADSVTAANHRSTQGVARIRLDLGQVIWLAVACLPFYFYGTLPAITLALVIAGSFAGYIGRPMPMAKQMMVPGFVVGIVGTSLVKILSRQLGYVFLVTSVEALWWSAWFAFCLAPLVISLVLQVRGVRPRNAQGQN